MSYKTIVVGGDKAIYLKLPEGMTRVRIVSEAIPVWTEFNKTEKTAAKWLNEALAHDHPDAKKRHALWVIDRTDGKIKLAEWGPQIMEQIQTLANDSDYEFDDLPSYDLKITRTGVGFDTEYVVTPSPASPLTDDEKARIAELEPVSEFLKKQPNVHTSDMQ